MIISDFETGNPPEGQLRIATQLIAAGKPLPQKLLLAGTEARPTKAAGVWGKFKILYSMLHALCLFYVPLSFTKKFDLCAFNLFNSMPYALCSMLTFYSSSDKRIASATARIDLRESMLRF